MTDFRMDQLPRSGTERTGFVSGDSRTKGTVVLLSIGILVDVTAVLSGLVESSLVRAILGGRSVSEHALEANDARQGGIGLLQLAVFVATSVAFCFWIHRACRNLPALGATGLRFSPGWAVGWFFVPVWSFVRPYQVMSELWRASDPKAGIAAGDGQPSRAVDGSYWTRVPGSSLVGWWWGLFILMGVLGRASASASKFAKDPASLLRSSYVTLSSDVVSILAAAVTVALVTAVNARQGKRSALLYS
jgi:hypothetical protein